MKPIVVLDFEYKHYGERLCGECKKPIFIKDKEGYIKEYEYCPHCGTKGENFDEGDEIIYAKRTIEGYEYFDKEEKIKRERELIKKRKANQIGHVLLDLETFICNTKELNKGQLEQLMGAKEIIRGVLDNIGEAHFEGGRFAS